MYEEFFGLTSSPFDLSPDPYFLFSSEKSREALASISYAVSRRKGFVVMTGEVGTGKTLILRCLFKLWERGGGGGGGENWTPHLGRIRASKIGGIMGRR